MNERKPAFTLIEMLATIAIIALLAGLLLPAFGRARDSSKALTCQTRFREVARGWQIYADENDGALVAARLAKLDDPSTPDKNEDIQNVGNGQKKRPRWLAVIGGEIGIHAFNKPDPTNDRQDYDNEVYQCPEVSNWVDERNHGFGYNYQFLGNGRQANKRFVNFPVILSQIKATSGTVVAADALGTAASFSRSARTGYTNDAPDRFQNMGNHAYTLDPPRITDNSDRGEGVTENPLTPRSAVDPRHRDKANAVFADGHAEARTPHELGYRTTSNGCFANEPDAECTEPGGGPGQGSSTYSPPDGRLVGTQVQGPPPGGDGIDWANNRFFSGTGHDDDPPALPQ